MDLLTSDSYVGIFGAVTVIAVMGALVTAIAFALRTHFAQARAAKLVTQARNQITLGIFNRDENDRPGPAELLGEAYRLQKQFGFKAEVIGLRDDAELDELISRAIRGNAPPAPPPADDDEVTVPNAKVQVPDFSLREERPTDPDGTLAERIATTHAQSATTADGQDDVDDYLRDCADMAAGLAHRTSGNDEVN